MASSGETLLFDKSMYPEKKTEGMQKKAVLVQQVVSYD